jgi:hypothetical protein
MSTTTAFKDLLPLSQTTVFDGGVQDDGFYAVKTKGDNDWFISLDAIANGLAGKGGGEIRWFACREKLGPEAMKPSLEGPGGRRDGYAEAENAKARDH